VSARGDKDLIDDREDLLVADYGQIAIYIKAGTRTFDTCLGMTQGMTQSWRKSHRSR
jgi:hypothetical protein